ncbi:MAG: hypothetical protein IPL26_23320 [Leptospiraceae bacterium]|nr:hypothetical protein [Leptospiraceae bacterium]
MAKHKNINNIAQDFSGILLDTSFLIAFLNRKHKFHESANEYYEYFQVNNIPTYISVISIGEYCVKGDIEDLPLEKSQILPYNILDAKKAGEFTFQVFAENKKEKLEISERIIIPNDVKLFAQAELNDNISHCISRDEDFLKIYNTLSKSKKIPKLKIINLNKPFNEEMGYLPLKDKNESK